jgi:hypothetical protein
MEHTDKTAGPGPEWSIRVQDNQALIKPEKKKTRDGQKATRTERKTSQHKKTNDLTEGVANSGLPLTKIEKAGSKGSPRIASVNRCT